MTRPVTISLLGSPVGFRPATQHMAPRLIAAPRNAPPAMNRPLTVTLMGTPIAWSRPRTGNGAFFIPARQRNTAAALRMAAQTEMQAAGIAMYREPVSVHLRAEFAVPASWSKKKRGQGILGLVRPGRPDIDNLWKLVGDSFNRVVFLDDALVAELHCEKRYSLEPKLIVTVRPLLRALERGEAAE